MEDIKSIFLAFISQNQPRERNQTLSKTERKLKVWGGNNKKGNNKEKKSIKVKDTSLRN